MRCDVEINGRARHVDVERVEGAFVVTIDGRRHTADVTVINGMWSLLLEPEGGGVRRSYEIAIDAQTAGSGGLTIHVNGCLVSAAVGALRSGRSTTRGRDAAIGGAAADGAPRHLTAPMPGKVVKLLVRAGDTVAARQALIVVEAMKMENELRSPRAGRVAEIKVVEGASVDAGAILAVIE